MPSAYMSEQHMQRGSGGRWVSAAIVAAALVGTGAVAFSEDGTLPQPAAAAASDTGVQTLHAIATEGGPLAYTATAGTLRVQEPNGDARADVFYVAYRKDGEDPARRPLTFVLAARARARPGCTWAAWGPGAWR
jgi:carboxypeptidase C (cathepsin A)